MKQMIKGLAKTVKVLYFTMAMLLFFSKPACAYIDPSTTTFVVQAVSGAAVAIGAFVVVMWRRFRKKVNKKLNLDQNKNKEIEDDIRET